MMESKESSRSLTGQRLSFTGTLASMTHAQAQELAEQHGGEATAHVSKQTTMLVVGEEGWPLEDDGRPSVKLQQVSQWRNEGLDIQIVNESEWLRLLGLEKRRSAIHRLYTPAMLSQMLGIPVHVIRRWERLGLIRAVRKTFRLPYFEYQEVSSARRLCQLIDEGVALEKLESSLKQLRGYLVDSQRPLAQLHILARGSGVVYRDSAGLVDPASRQRLFDFEFAEGTAEEAEPPEAVPPGVTTPEQLNWRFTEWYEQGCRLLEQHELESAIEAFRLCLMERPTSPEVNFQLAEALYRFGNTQGALERYHVVVELDHEYIEAWTQLGCLHAELGQLELALQAFEIALKTHPEFPDALYQKAQTLHLLGRTDEAEACWQTYLQFDAHGPWADTARQHLTRPWPLLE